MAGYRDFFRKRLSQAQSFLATGNLQYNPLPVAGSNITGCYDSSDCASGWACIGGGCVKEESSSADGSGNTSGCGNGGADGSLPGQCGAGTTTYLTLDKDLSKVYQKALANLKPGDVLLRTGLDGGTVGNGLIGLSLNGKCLKTGCSGKSTALGTNDACCGKGRCCRLGSVVQCFCGECPPPPQRCSKFCTSYLSANGTSAPGCTGENTCDECSFCTDLGNFAGTACIPKSGSGPCWCGDGIGRSCTTCEKCDEDGTCSSDFANCVPTPLPPIVEDEGTPEADPCAGVCTTLTVCGSQPDPPCPPKSSCRQSGTITVGSQTCRLFEQCNKSEVPAECGFCDCNCDNDCPSCQLCGSNGKCYPDPNCPSCNDGVICPNSPGDECCEPDEICYQPDSDDEEHRCCPGRTIDIYENIVKTGSRVNDTITYKSIGGPLIMSTVDPCGCGTGFSINCGGNTVLCSDPSARRRLRLVNYWSPSNSDCQQSRGITICQPYKDPKCNWNGGPFEPVLLSSTITNTICCLN